MSTPNLATMGLLRAVLVLRSIKALTPILASTFVLSGWIPLLKADSDTTDDDALVVDADVLHASSIRKSHRECRQFCPS